MVQKERQGTVASGQAPAAHFAHRPAPCHRAWGLAEQARRGLPQRVPAGPAQHLAHISFLGVGPTQVVPSRSFELSKQTGSLMTTSGTCVPLVESAFKFIFVGGKVRSSACPPAPNFARDPRNCNHAACSAPDPDPKPKPKPNRVRLLSRAVRHPRRFFRRQGGVGKTTTSSSLAIQLSYTRKVCIDDFVESRQTFYALSRIGSAAVDGPCAQPQRCIPAAVR